jgi:hypothetical protein
MRVVIWNNTKTRIGSALAVKNWAWQQTNPNESLPAEVPYANQDRLIESVKQSLEAGKKIAGKEPKILVIGAVSTRLIDKRSISNDSIAWTLRQRCCAAGSRCWYPR